MSKGRGLTSSRILTSRNDILVGGSVVGNNLVLTKYSGSTVDVGSVRGVTGSNGNPAVLYSAVSVVTTSIANNVFTALTGWSFLEGTSSLISLSSSNFTVSQPGFYIISFSATFAANAVGRRMCMIYKNGVERRRFDGFGSPATLQVETILYLNSGDILAFYVYQSSGAALAMLAGPGHDVTIVKVG